MYRVESTTIASVPMPDVSSPEEDAVRSELNRILVSKHFKNSKRCPLFLRFIVERTLLDDTERIKERTLGIELFGRSTNYATSEDPIVRVTAGEVRKRLARYYQDSVPASDVQIYLPVGSYIPEFRTQPSLSQEIERPSPPTELPARPQSPSLVPVDAPVAPTRGKRVSIHLAYGSLILLLGLSTAALLSRKTAGVKAKGSDVTALDLLWAPILDFSGTLNFYTEAVSVSPDNGHVAMDQVPIADFETKAQLVPESTAFAGMATFTYLMNHNKHFVVRTGTKADFQSFQNGPSIILGMSNDFWVKKAVAQMRYTIVSSPSGVDSIQDTQHPEHTFASVNARVPYGAASDDYAIIGRVRDHDSGHWLLVATGIGDAGMLAAGRFLRNPQYSQSLLQAGRTDWGPGRNVEIILRAHVINGVGGPPQLVANVSW